VCLLLSCAFANLRYSSMRCCYDSGSLRRHLCCTQYAYHSSLEWLWWPVIYSSFLLVRCASSCCDMLLSFFFSCASSEMPTVHGGTVCYLFSIGALLLQVAISMKQKRQEASRLWGEHRKAGCYQGEVGLRPGWLTFTAKALGETPPTAA